MNAKAWFKSKTADRVLLPLRKELLALIEHDTRVLEVGCGTGDLLFQAAEKIRQGQGVDIDPGMIHYAESKRQKRNLNNLTFECGDALLMPPRTFDVATSTLCLHEMPKQKACELLTFMVDHSSMALIADFSKADSALGKLSIEVDELFSGHYRYFKQYRHNGGIPAYAECIGATVDKEIKSVVEGISIWLVRKHA